MDGADDNAQAAEERRTFLQAAALLEECSRGAITPRELRLAWPDTPPDHPVHEIAAVVLPLLADAAAGRRGAARGTEDVAAVVRRCVLFLRSGGGPVLARPEGDRVWGQAALLVVWVALLAFILRVVGQRPAVFRLMPPWVARGVFGGMLVVLFVLLPLGVAGLCHVMIRPNPRPLSEGRWRCWPFADESALGAAWQARTPPPPPPQPPPRAAAAPRDV
jgi:hypothetical protein